MYLGVCKFLKDNGIANTRLFSIQEVEGAYSFARWDYDMEAPALDYQMAVLSLKEEKIKEIKALRDALNLAPMETHQAKELIEGQNGTYTIGQNKTFSFITTSTGNPASEPNSLCFAVLLNPSSTYYLRYSCTIIEGQNRRKGYVAITKEVAASLMAHAEQRNTQNIMLCNKKEELINACTTLEELEEIDTTTLQ